MLPELLHEMLEFYNPSLLYIIDLIPDLAFWSSVIILPFPLWTIAKMFDNPREALSTLAIGVLILVGFLVSLYTALIPWFFIGILYFIFMPWILLFGIPIACWMLLCCGWEAISTDEGTWMDVMVGRF